MDPFHHHHHHHNDDEDEENRRHPPPDHNPFHHVSHVSHEYNPPPFEHVSHERPPDSYGYDRPTTESYGYDRPPQESYGYDRPPHESYGYERPPESYGYGEDGRHGYRPHHDVPPPGYYSGVQHVGHESAWDGEDESEIRRPQGQTYRIFTKADEGFSLSIRNGQVVLARNDPDDEFQLWIKDLKYSTKVKDAEGFPAFALVNKVTGEAIKHSLGQNHPVQLVKYNPDYLDESVLWSESKDVGDGFRCIRMVNNIHLNFDAFNGDKDHGGVKDGTTVVLWEWWKGDNQKWKIVPH